MSSLLLRAAARFIIPLQLILSVLVMLRGHNEPGGGFVGGLLAACAILTYGYAYSMPAARKAMRMPPHVLIGLGLLLACGSGLPSLLAGEPLLTGLWAAPALETFVVGKLKFGTPLVFDIGVYLVVAGIAVLMVFSLTDPKTR